MTTEATVGKLDPTLHQEQDGGDSGRPSGANSEQKDVSNIGEDNNNNNKCDLNQQQGFAVVWHNLTYRVDSRRWYTKTKERFFSRSDSDSPSVCEEGGFGADNNASIRSKEKIILDHICGSIKSRQLTAIMGPSGAGKSSLLHCLFQNRSAGVTGKILVESRSKSKLKVCFIPQRDYLNEWLTVREDLIYVSRLKSARINGLFREDSSEPTIGLQQSNPNEESETKNNSYVRQDGKECNTSLIDHEANALRVSGLLGLNNCLDVMIKNISGGQKKRLSIARELMSKPDVLILDEPTTGLDSLTCYKTVMLLKDLTQLSPNPMAVVVTIHQPQREVFNIFDKTYMISNRGRVIYEGNPRTAGEILENVGRLKFPTPKYNPASFLIDIASDDSQITARKLLYYHQRTEFYREYDIARLKRLFKPKSSGVQNWKFCTFEDGTSNYSASSSAVRSMPTSTSNDIIGYNLEILNRPTNDETNIKEVISNRSSSNRAIPVTETYYISHQLSDCLSSHSSNLLQSFKHIFILTSRSWLSVIRNPSFTNSRLAFHIILPLMMLVVFGNSMGKPNACPKLESELSVQQMRRNIDNGVVSQNVEETRLSLENMSFYFILIYGFGMNIISCTASFYPLTMHMFKKETINGLYSPGSYFIGHLLAELPLEIFFPALSVILSYQLSGQISSFMGWRMFCISYILSLVTYAIHSLGLLSGSIFVENVSVSVLFGQVLLLPFVMLSGFLIRPDRMAAWMFKLSYTSPFKHAMNAIMAARYGFNVCDCQEDLLPTKGGGVGIRGLTPQVKRVVEYMFPKNSTDGNIGNGIPITEVFQRLGDRFIKAQTYALDIKSCKDVKPYLLHIFNVDDSLLFYSVIYILIFIVVLKVTTFSIMRSFPYRIN